MGALVISNKQLPPAFPLLLNFLMQIYLHKLKSLSSQRFQLLSKKLCTHLDDWYLFAIGNYIESTKIEREILRQLLPINGYNFSAQKLHPLLSNSFRTVSTFVSGKSRLKLRWQLPVRNHPGLGWSLIAPRRGLGSDRLWLGAQGSKESLGEALPTKLMDWR
jgi:hypothetical protein